MSGMRLTIGVIAQLVHGYGDYNEPAHQEFQADLEEMESPLKLTYGGDMIVYIASDSRTDYDGPGLNILDNDIMDQFGMALIQANLMVYQGSQKVFVDHWYDGADPPHIDISLSDAGYTEDM